MAVVEAVVQAVSVVAGPERIDATWAAAAEEQVHDGRDLRPNASGRHWPAPSRADAAAACGSSSKKKTKTQARRVARARLTSLRMILLDLRVACHSRLHCVHYAPLRAHRA